ncbi:PTS cellobiose transporter subunit IIA [Bacillus anthracis]|nr:PTS cellobiose transporter subunit IIA [Bacillus anthracis]
MADMQTPFQLILNSGNARSIAMEAIQFAKQGKMEKANEKMTKAKEEIKEAHHIQTDLIQKEARGEKTEISLLLVHAQDHLMNAITVKERLLLVHAQDHLMNAITVKELAEEFINLHKKIEEKVIA